MSEFNEKSNHFFGILFEAVPEGIIVVNMQREIVASNSSANELFGYKKESLIGKPLHDLIPQKYHHNHGEHFNAYVKKSNKRQMGAGRDLFGQHKNGNTFPVEVGLNPFKLEEQQYILAIVIDISVRKNQESQILDLNSRLEQKIVERTEELNDKVDQLKKEISKRKIAENKIKESLKEERELNELKTKFLSLVSHEFKTPLSGILTSVILAGKYTKTEQQDKREKHLNIIQNKVKYLNNILNDFLSIERLETGKVNYLFSTFPLSKVINEVVYNANMLVKEGQKINYPNNIDGIVIEFDEKIIELVLSNLLHNAIKYSPENTLIDLEVFQKSSKLTIQVKDQGFGIPKKEQKFIFNRYFRAENALLHQGTGIGLNIAKSHLENLGGSITFTSTENVGSTFTVQIPTNNKL